MFYSKVSDGCHSWQCNALPVIGIVQYIIMRIINLMDWDTSPHAALDLDTKAPPRILVHLGRESTCSLGFGTLRLFPLGYESTCGLAALDSDTKSLTFVPSDTRVHNYTALNLDTKTPPPPPGYESTCRTETFPPRVRVHMRPWIWTPRLFCPLF